MLWLRKYTFGLLFVIVLALTSTWLGRLVPVIGGPVFGIVLGLLINNIAGKPRGTINGVLFSAKKVLQWAIIALGCGLSLSKVWHTGFDSLDVMTASLFMAFITAYLFGKWLKIPIRMIILIGAGTGICGGSAIAAISPIIQAEEVEVAYAISTIFLFNVAAILLFPHLGHLLGLSDKAFGLWAGTAINDTSSVVATGYLYSNIAGDYATIVKLTRATMIIPISLLLAYFVRLRNKKNTVVSQSDVSSSGFANVFPWFILWFLAASLFNTFGLFSPSAIHDIGMLAQFMIVMALTGIGLSADFRKMLRTGGKPLILGLIVWFLVAITSLLVQRLTGQI